MEIVPFSSRVHQPLNCISAFNLIDISSGDIIQWIELRKSFLKHNNSFFVWWCIQVDNSCTPGLSLQVIYYERMFLLPNNWWKKVTFMLFLFRDFDLICVMQSNTTPDEIAVHNLDQFNLRQNIFIIVQIFTSQSSSVNMSPVVLINSTIASNSSSWEQIGWQRTLPDNSCNKTTRPFINTVANTKYFKQRALYRNLTFWRLRDWACYVKEGKRDS